MDLRLLALLLIGAVFVDAASRRREKRQAAFDCRGLADGDYPDPTNYCTPVFYKCSPIGATPQSCPTGSVYDPLMKICNWIASVPQCVGRPTAPAIQMPPPAVSVLPPAFVIPPQPISLPQQPAFVIPPQPIALPPRQPAIIQSNPVAPPPAPTAGLISFSCNQNPAVPNAVPYFDCYQIANLRESLLAFDCIQRPGTQNGNVVFFDCYQKTVAGNSAPMPIQCSRFSAGSDFSCSSLGGSGLGFDCHTSGTRKSPLEPLAFGCIHKNALTTVPAIIPAAPVHSAVPVPQFDCSGKPTGNYPVSPCDNRFWQCASGVAFLTPCATTAQRYNPTNNQCLDPANVPGCSGRSRRQIDASTETSTVAPISFSCDGKPDGDYASPAAGCSRYFFKCASGRMSQESCPADLIYDTSLRVCNYPGSVQC